MIRRLLPLTAALVLLVPAAPAIADSRGGEELRVSTFNASLNRNAEGELVQDLSSPDDPQAAAVAEIVQRSRPDVLLVNEFDYDAEGRGAQLFQDNYLSRSQRGAKPIRYPYRYAAPSNTGIPSGQDLDNSGSIGGPNDAFGFGAFPGQFGMQVYSKHPIAAGRVRTFQRFLWRDMPGNRIPPGYYSDAELARLRLSSKSHWDIPIVVGRDDDDDDDDRDERDDRDDRRGGDGREVVHLLASHPTPPVFDGPEDRNGRRNADEIRFWADYVAPGRGGDYIYDDAGRRGGLPRSASAFVVAGDQNSDPLDGDSIPGAIQQLLDSPRIDSRFTPGSPGAVEQSARQGGANASHRSDPRFDTADFADSAPGNLRADYVLPSRRGLKVRGGFVYWPRSDSPLFAPVGTFPFPSSDHRLVALDTEVR